MHKIILFIFTLLISALFTACAKKEKQDEIVVKEYLEVQAVCIQQNSDIKVLFDGYLASIYNKTKQSEFRHGTVSYKKTVSTTKENFIAPSKIKFSKIKPETFAKPFIQLEGLSYSSINRDVFKTSCKIKVLKRLDHQPK